MNERRLVAIGHSKAAVWVSGHFLTRCLLAKTRAKDDVQNLTEGVFRRKLMPLGQSPR